MIISPVQNIEIKNHFFIEFTALWYEYILFNKNIPTDNLSGCLLFSPHHKQFAINLFVLVLAKIVFYVSIFVLAERFPTTGRLLLGVYVFKIHTVRSLYRKLFHFTNASGKCEYSCPCNFFSTDYSRPCKLLHL